MAPPAIPDRWLNYKPVGEKIVGTRFVAFKVPLRKEVVESVNADVRLSCESILKNIPNLGLIIDLTNTFRYYDSKFFTKRGIQYEKLMIPGHDIPAGNIVQTFKRMVCNYLKENAKNTKVIGVHCTHGVNRTGYLICSFMVSEMKTKPVDAIKYFEAARGHAIERQNYRDHLLRSTSTESNTMSSRIPRRNAFAIYPNQQSKKRYSEHNWRTRNPINSERTDPYDNNYTRRWQEEGERPRQRRKYTNELRD